jgi:hypothetical protein
MQVLVRITAGVIMCGSIAFVSLDLSGVESNPSKPLWIEHIIAFLLRILILGLVHNINNPVQSYSYILGRCRRRYLYKHKRISPCQRCFQYHYKLQPLGSPSALYLEAANTTVEEGHGILSLCSRWIVSLSPLLLNSRAFHISSVTLTCHPSYPIFPTTNL